MGLSSDTLLSRSGKNSYKFVECGSYCPSIPERQTSQDIISTSFFSDSKTRMSKESLPPPPPLAVFTSRECLNHHSKECLNLHHPECLSHPTGLGSRTLIPEALLPEQTHPITSRSDLASSYELSPACSNKQCHDNRCHSNESGVASGLGSTPPNSEVNFLKKEHELRKESWMSSEDSLFKVNKNNPASSVNSLQKAGMNDKRQVRFQKLNDSYV